MNLVLFFMLATKHDDAKLGALLFMAKAQNISFVVPETIVKSFLAKFAGEDDGERVTAINIY